jgi:DNA repair protein RadC
LLCATPEAIGAVVPDARIVKLVAAVRTAQLHVLRARLSEGPVLSSADALGDYLFAALAHQPRECVRVLFLNARNRLLRDESFGEGTPLQAVLQPREIVRRALEVGATALILVHNHPSGDPAPSKADVAATMRLASAAALLDMRLHDHVVVAARGLTSFRSMGLI